MAATKANPYYQTTQSHPYGHKIRLKAPSSSYAPRPISDRALTVNTIQITPRTVFELERPQSHGSPRVLIDINTSFHKGYWDRYKPQKRIPIFPKLATDPNSRPKSSTRAIDVSGRNVVALSRKQGNISPQRIDQIPNSNITLRETSSAMSNRKTSAGLRRTLSERQNSTFAAYAKYNDELKAVAKDDSIQLTENTQIQNVTNLNDFVMANRAQFPLFLSNEKHLRIADWVESTSKALLNDISNEEVIVPKSLHVIKEQ